MVPCCGVCSGSGGGHVLAEHAEVVAHLRLAGCRVDAVVALVADRRNLDAPLQRAAELGVGGERHVVRQNLRVEERARAVDVGGAAVRAGVGRVPLRAAGLRRVGNRHALRRARAGGLEVAGVELVVVVVRYVLDVQLHRAAEDEEGRRVLIVGLRAGDRVGLHDAGQDEPLGCSWRGPARCRP